MDKMTFYRDGMGRKHMRAVRVAWSAPVLFCQKRPELAKTMVQKTLARHWKRIVEVDG